MNNADLRKYIGSSLRKVRNDAGYKSARAFAEAFGMNPGTYADYEQGRSMPPIDRAYEFAGFLNCSIDDLCGNANRKREYSDPNQEAINICYENMNDTGKQTLVSVAKSLEKDASNRMEKSGEKTLDDTTALGA